MQVVRDSPLLAIFGYRPLNPPCRPPRELKTKHGRPFSPLELTVVALGLSPTVTLAPAY